MRKLKSHEKIRLETYETGAPSGRAVGDGRGIALEMQREIGRRGKTSDLRRARGRRGEKF